MTHRTGSAERPRYGAIELKDSAHFYMMAGLGIAIAIHLAAVTSYKLAGGTDEVLIRPGPISIYPGSTPWIPVSLNPRPLTGLNVANPGTKYSIGVPVPVDEASVDPGVTLAPNTEFSPSAGSEPGGTGGEIREPAPTGLDDPVPPPFEPVEVMPQVIRSAAPVYPDVAVLAGLEGKVIVKLWVDREGKPRDASVVKSDADIFNDAAIAAAKQFLFTPAIMNGTPVSVWITIPFRFRLAERR